MKKYILIAGVNGAGKSTLYQSLPSLKKMPRVNTDEIVRTFGRWSNINDTTIAGKIAAERVHNYFNADVTFNQETTLCGSSIIRNIITAKEKSYYIELHYISVENVDIAKNRVKERVAKGGHGIPDEGIERRYAETFKNLKKVMPYCDKITFYDNSHKFHRFAVYENGKEKIIYPPIPKWFNKFAIVNPSSTQESVFSKRR